MQSDSSKHRKGKKAMQIWWLPEIYGEIQAAAKRANEPLAVWVRRAVRAQLRKEKLPSMEKFPICAICGRKHDSQEHFGGGTE